MYNVLIFFGNLFYNNAIKLFFGIIEEKTVSRVSTGLALKPDYRKTYVGLLSKAGGTSVVAIRGAGKTRSFIFPKAIFLFYFGGKNG